MYMGATPKIIMKSAEHVLTCRVKRKSRHCCDPGATCHEEGQELHLKTVTKLMVEGKGEEFKTEP